MIIFISTFTLELENSPPPFFNNIHRRRPSFVFRLSFFRLFSLRTKKEKLRDQKLLKSHIASRRGRRRERRRRRYVGVFRGEKEEDRREA